MGSMWGWPLEASARRLYRGGVFEGGHGFAAASRASTGGLGGPLEAPHLGQAARSSSRAGAAGSAPRSSLTGRAPAKNAGQNPAGATNRSGDFPNARASKRYASR